jgi:hypothetical protein
MSRQLGPSGDARLKPFIDANDFCASGLRVPAI